MKRNLKTLLLSKLVLGLAALLAACGLPGLAAEEGKEPPKKEGAEKEKPKKDPKDMNADEAEAAGLCPVCKLESKLIYHFDIGEKKYHFATRKCYKAFSEEPAKYGAKPVKSEGGKKEAKKTAPPAKEDDPKNDPPGMMGE